MPLKIEQTKYKKYDECNLKCDMRTLWHGTTLGRAKNIAKEGFKPLILMEGEHMGEGMSSAHHEGGLFFFGIDNSKGKELAERHAYRAGRQFSDEPALIKVKACICNELTNDMITENFHKKLVDRAEKEDKEKTHPLPKNPSYSLLHRFTYGARFKENDAFEELEGGVMPDYNVGLIDIINHLGYDAMDGGEQDIDLWRKYKISKALSTILASNKPIMDMEIIPLKKEDEGKELGER